MYQIPRHIIYLLAIVAFISIVAYNRKKTIRFARQFLGQKEKAGNIGFQNPQFETYLKEYGNFAKGDPWCAVFVRAAWMWNYGKRYPQLDSLLHKHVLTMYRNFQNDTSGKFIVNQTPKTGAIFIMNKGGGNGHTGFVENVYNDGTFSTIEGNTNEVGGREGVKVGRVIRKQSDAQIVAYIHLKQKFSFDNIRNLFSDKNA